MYHYATLALDLRAKDALTTYQLTKIRISAGGLGATTTTEELKFSENRFFRIWITPTSQEMKILENWYLDYTHITRGVKILESRIWTTITTEGGKIRKPVLKKIGTENFRHLV